MVYPVFNIESIENRCIDDIKKFLDKEMDKEMDKDDKEMDNTTIKLVDNTTIKLVIKEDEMNSKQKMESIITNILAIMNCKFGLSGKSYVHEISHIDKENQNQLWIARTYLFYQLLIFATISFSSKVLYDSVYSDLIDFPYREDIVAELGHFKMGIFGSITPTSDIDIGIQYSGTELSIPGLAYIVSRFENLFIIFTGSSSLDFDIETYADMMTIPNPTDSYKNHPDYFYLDSSKFTETEFERMLQCAGNSIVRNALLAHNHINETVDLKSITFKSIIDSVPELSLFENIIDIDIKNLLLESKLESKWFDDSKKEVSAFLSKNYDEGRKEYYKQVNIAETLKFEKIKQGLTNLRPTDVCDIMIEIGKALTYRMESYTCAPTVIHVVRILQASKADAEKYITLEPKTYCNGDIINLDPFCTIGYFGYILSILEQIGYIYRFQITYCQETKTTYDSEKCIIKKNKYNDRYKNALIYLEKTKDLKEKTKDLNKTMGGKKRRQSIKRKYSKRHYKKRSKKSRKINVII
jgi:hypothetical protein